MDMPKVKMCDATKCAFNQGNNCHALAVTIGDAQSAACDTFMVNKSKGGEIQEIAGVGACKMEDCEHNEGLYCTAKTIEVKQSSDGPVCATYNPVKATAKA